MENYSASDLVDFALTQKPVEFEDAFNSIIANKLTAAVDMKKVEVAQSIFPSNDYEEDDR
ncbi:hypothetical protein UFOVP1071_176 [uncultured Caudovirales phage]|uniref:Uncharacterized protein n=1 Tax=uncultured Caudovirales phage TaxID=2100421 RepID=A0A6J5QMK2_9CAUD|nr:hypothetical protein UFOVP1071_176 [uncultured Caudovirales phage]